MSQQNTTTLTKPVHLLCQEGDRRDAYELSSHIIFRIETVEKFGERCFRRNAENHTPEVYAPRNMSSRPFFNFGVRVQDYLATIRCNCFAVVATSPSVQTT